MVVTYRSLGHELYSPCHRDNPSHGNNIYHIQHPQINGGNPWKYVLPNNVIVRTYTKNCATSTINIRTLACYCWQFDPVPLVLLCVSTVHCFATLALKLAVRATLQCKLDISPGGTAEYQVSTSRSFCLCQVCSVVHTMIPRLALQTIYVRPFVCFLFLLGAS